MVSTFFGVCVVCGANREWSPFRLASSTSPPHPAMVFPPPWIRARSTLMAAGGPRLSSLVDVFVVVRRCESSPPSSRFLSSSAFPAWSSVRAPPASLPSPPRVPRLDAPSRGYVGVVRRTPSSDDADGPSSSTSSSVRSPFESRGSSATARAASPLPGRLVRLPRATRDILSPSSPPPADDPARRVEGDGESPGSSPLGEARDVDGGDSPSSPSGLPPIRPPTQSRQAPRRAAIERRRLLLERGAATGTMAPPLPTPSEAPESDATTATSSDDDESANDGKGNEGELESEKDIIGQSTPPRQSQVELQRQGRVPLHSLVAGGRSSSAADLHRSKLSQRRRRDHLKKPELEEQQEQRPEDGTTHPRDGERAIAATATASSNEPSARGASGGSVVAARSATAQYRLRRRQLRTRDAVAESNSDAGTNLKMNPSAATIPLETDIAYSDDDDHRVGVPSSSPAHSDENFEDRYERWRGRQRWGEGVADGGEGPSPAADRKGGDGSWSPLGWLWGEKK